MTRRNSTSERGSASVEMVLITPVLVMLLLFVVAVGRLAGARGEVDAAARDAARAAANARSAPEQAALRAAHAALRDRGVECQTLDVGVDTTRFGADGFVEVTVMCTVDLRAVAGIGFPVTPELRATFVAPVDRYRGVNP